jgi:hypothetical protein
VALATLATALSALGGCSRSAPRDVVPESHDVRGVRESVAHESSGASGSYAHVARRPHAVVGLIGAKHMGLAEATRIANLVADELESCAITKERDGTLAVGAASFVLVATTRGAAVSDLHLAPGGPVAANAMECIMAPARTIQFPQSADTEIPALAIDATWNPIGIGKAPPVR